MSIDQREYYIKNVKVEIYSITFFILIKIC